MKHTISGLRINLLKLLTVEDDTSCDVDVAAADAVVGTGVVMLPVTNDDVVLLRTSV